MHDLEREHMMTWIGDIREGERPCIVSLYLKYNLADVKKASTSFDSLIENVQWNLDTASLDTAVILLLSQFWKMSVFFPSLSLLISPRYNVIFTTSILLQR